MTAPGSLPTEPGARRPALGLFSGQAVLHLLATMALGAVLWRALHRQPLALLDVLAIVVPIGFTLESLLVIWVGTRLAGRERRIVLAADLATWAMPYGVLLGQQLGGSPAGIPLWITAAIAVKTLVGFGALLIAVRHGFGDQRTAGALGILVVFVALVSLPYTRFETAGVHLTGDEPHYMVMTISLIRDHDLRLDNEYTDNVARDFYTPDSPPLEPQIARSQDGHLAPYHDAGLSILAIIPYLIGGYRGVLVALGLATGLLVREMYLIVRLAGAGAAPALAATAIGSFSLPVILYATQIFPEVPVALLAAVVVRRFWLEQNAPRGWRNALAAGCTLAILPWLHFRSWPIILPAVGIGWWLWRGWRDRAALTVPVVALAVLYLVFNFVVFGRVVLSPNVGPATQAMGVPSVAELFIGEARPWLDGFHGLLLLAPAFALALAAWPWVARMGPAGLFVVVATIAYCVTVGAFWGRSNPGLSPPGRYMVPAIPLLTASLGVALGKLRGPWLDPFLVLAIVWGFACAFFTLVARPASYPHTPDSGPLAALGSYIHVPVAFLLPVYTQPPRASYAVVIGTVALIALLSLYLLWCWRQESPDPASVELT